MTVIFEEFKEALIDDHVLRDPGNAGRIMLQNRMRTACGLTAAGTETRTLEDPSDLPVRAQILLFSKSAQTITISSLTGVDQSGNSSHVFSAINDWAIFEVMPVSGTKRWRRVQDSRTSSGLDLNGAELFLDANADTSFTADTDDQLDLKIGGTDYVTWKEAAAADAGTTRSIQEIAFTSPVDTTGTNIHAGLNIDIEIGNATGGTNSVYAILIDGLTGDAQVTETAISIGAGWDVGIELGEAINVKVGTTTGSKIGTATSQKLGFFNATPVVQQSALTAQLTTVTHTAPGTPDYAVQDLTQTTPFGFVTKDEGNTVLSVVANMQARLAQVETALENLGFIAAN